MANQELGLAPSSEEGIVHLVYQADRSQIMAMFRDADDLVVHMNNGSIARVDSFFIPAGGADKVLLLQESDGSVWQTLFAHNADYTVMAGYTPYEVDAALADVLPPTTEAGSATSVAPTGTWDGYSIEISGYADDRGDAAQGTSTEDATPRLKGTAEGLQPGDRVQVYEGKTLLGVAEVDASGNWYFDVPETSAGRHLYIARIVSAAGLESDFFGSLVLNVASGPSSTLPAWLIVGLGVGTGLAFIFADDSSSKKHYYAKDVEITRAEDTEGTIQGTILTGGVTDDKALELHGTLSSSLNYGESLIIYRTDANGNTIEVGRLGVDVLGESTDWTFTAGLEGVADGTYTYTACIANTFGMTGKLSEGFTVTLDTRAPSAENGYSIEIVDYTSDTGSEPGNFEDGSTTNDSTPALNGKVDGLQAGDFIRIYEGETLLGTAALDSEGNWSFEVPGTSEGEHTYTAVVVDAAGNEGVSAELSLTIDLFTDVILGSGENEVFSEANIVADPDDADSPSGTDPDAEKNTKPIGLPDGFRPDLEKGGWTEQDNSTWTLEGDYGHLTWDPENKTLEYTITKAADHSEDAEIFDTFTTSENEPGTISLVDGYGNKGEVPIQIRIEDDTPSVQILADSEGSEAYSGMDYEGTWSVLFGADGPAEGDKLYVKVNKDGGESEEKAFEIDEEITLADGSKILFNEGTYIFTPAPNTSATYSISLGAEDAEGGLVWTETSLDLDVSIPAPPDAAEILFAKGEFLDEANLPQGTGENPEALTRELQMPEGYFIAVHDVEGNLVDGWTDNGDGSYKLVTPSGAGYLIYDENGKTLTYTLEARMDHDSEGNGRDFDFDVIPNLDFKDTYGNIFENKGTVKAEIRDDAPEVSLAMEAADEDMAYTFDLTVAEGADGIESFVFIDSSGEETIVPDTATDLEKAEIAGEYGTHQVWKDADGKWQYDYKANEDLSEAPEDAAESFNIKVIDTDGDIVFANDSEGLSFSLAPYLTTSEAPPEEDPDDGGETGSDEVTIQLAEDAASVFGITLESLLGEDEASDVFTETSRINLADLLDLANQSGFEGAEGAEVSAEYNEAGEAELVNAGNIEDYLQVTPEDGNTVIKIDLDGAGEEHQMTDLLVLNNTETDLATLLAANQLALY